MGEQGRGVILYTDTLQVVPGRVCTVAIPLANPSSQGQKVTYEVGLPSGWRNLTAEKELVLEGEGQKNLLLHLYPSSSALAGPCEVRCEVRFPDREERYLVLCKVEEVHKVEMTFGKMPPYLKAGDTLRTTLQVANAGNVEEDMLVIIKRDGAPSKKKRMRIKPLSSQVMAIREVTDRATASQVYEGLYATASPVNGKKPLAYANTGINLIPAKEKAYDLYRRIPSHLSISYVGSYRDSSFRGGMQFEACGSGYWDKKQQHKLLYRLRGPNLYRISSLGNYDEYFVKYQGPSITAVLGDHSYGMSLLTEYARHGRGGSFTARFGRASVGGIYLHPRFYPRLKREIGLFADYNVYKENRVRINYLYKGFRERMERAHITSVQAFLTPWKDTHLELEYALSKQGEKSGNAASAKLSSSFLEGLGVNGYLVYAHKNFAGYYNNSLHYGSTVAYRLSEKMRVNAGISKTEYNVALDTLFVQAPERRNNFLGISYRLNKANSFSLNSGFRSGKDRLKKKRYDYQEYYGRINYYLTTKKLRLFSVLELSLTDNLLLSDSLQKAWRQHFSSNITYTVAPHFEVGGFFSLSRHNRYSRKVENYLFAGASLNAKVAQKTTASLRLQNAFSIEEDYRDRSYLSLGLSHYFTPRHEWQFQGRYATPRKELNRAFWEFRTAYRYHFGLPVGRKIKRLATLKGRVHSCDEAYVSAEGVLLHLAGKSTYTDQEGNFTFRNMEPGDHFLLVDPSTMAMDVVTDPPGAIKVTLEAEVENFCAIQLLQGASVTGKIVIKQDPDKEQERYEKSKALRELSKPDALIPVLVELYNGEVSHKRISDQKGNFEFQQVLPGRWKLKIHFKGLSRKYEIKKREFDLELKPGEHKIMEVPIAPKKIKINFKPVTLGAASTVR
ncbi:MAG: hypothetical protein CSA95_03685 [Bacteroidetes bacterium]|nr:MAG: hypothetical protein CSA95_03685 [Bacteroidota bacterium]PIE87832.1 MAG: hypothetical protein CSA04_04995 [Bacteroidota bacterium]